MKPPLLFSEYLQTLMRDHGLNVSALGAITGSKTELKRALEENLGADKRLRLYQRLAALNLFTEEERRVLSSARRVSDIGQTQCLMRIALYSLMDMPLPNMRIDAQPSQTLAERLQPLHGADRVRLLCVNSCYPAVFQTLQPFFEDPDRDIELRHYVRPSRYGCDAATLTRCAYSFIREPRYAPYFVADEADMQCFSGDFLFAQCWRGDKRTVLFLAVKDENEVYSIPVGAHFDAYQLASDVIDGIRPSPRPLRELAKPASGYVDAMMRYLALELNRPTAILCGDLGCLHVPPDISDAAMTQEKLAEIGLTDPASIARLKKVIERRYLNCCNKKKPDYHTTTYDGMERFLQTGRSAAHFAGYRDFTMEERTRIVRHMLDMARRSPSYHLRALRQPGLLTNYTIVCFDKLGVSVIPTRGGYRVGNGFGYLMMTAPGFVDEFTKCFRNHILPDLCDDEATTLSRLEDMLAKYER